MLAAYRLRSLLRATCSQRSLRFENLETRLPAAADFNWPEVAALGAHEVAAVELTAASPVSNIAAKPTAQAADSFFSALDACGDLLNVVGRGAEDTVITAALRK